MANLISSSFTLLLLAPWIIKIKPVFDSGILRKMLAYSFPLLLAGVSGSLNDALDKIILRRLIGNDSGLETVGVYGAAYKIAVLMALFIQMFRFAAEPFFFERAKQSDAKETYAAVMKYFVIVMLILWLFINSYLAGIQYIVGAGYREAMQVVPIISMGYLFYGIYINHSIWYKLTDMTIFAVYITAIGALITVLINILFVPAFGYMASAWAHVASYGAMILFSFWFAEKRYKIDYNMARLVPYFLIAVVFVIAGRLIHYKNLETELAINSVLMIVFVLFAQKRDNIIGVFLKRT
jgi:O-antigen/teichoic acid export membrane protein